MPTDHEFNDFGGQDDRAFEPELPLIAIEPIMTSRLPGEHVHDRACRTDDLHCPDRMQDSILIKNAADAEFWMADLPKGVTETHPLNSPRGQELSNRWQVGRPHEQGSATDVLPVSLTHTAEQPRTLREILFTHRALAAATALEITELMAELEPLFRRPDPSGITADVLVDARRLRDDARGRDQLFRSAHHQSLVSPDRGTHEGLWVKNNPGLVALLQAVDGA